MLKNKLYTFSEFNNIIKESANEFKPKFGKNVANDNKKNNEKAVDDIMRQAKKFDGGLRKTSKKTEISEVNSDDKNKTTLDYNFNTKPSDDYKDRVKSQVNGYPSTNSEKDADSYVEYDANKEFYKKQQKKHKEMSSLGQDDKAAGLKSRMLDKKNFKDNSAFKNESNNNGKLKIIHYKNTVFVNEESMLKKVPDSFKTDGNEFIVKDASGTQYMVECKINDKFNFAELKVVGKVNPSVIKEELEKIKSLYTYKSGDYFKPMDSKQRSDENTNLGNLIESVRQLENNGNTNKV